MSSRLAVTCRRLSFLVVVGVFIPIIVFCLTWYHSEREELLAADQVKAQRIVMYTMGLLHHIDDDVAMGRLSIDEGQEQAKRLLLGPQRTDGTRDYRQSIVGANEREYIYAVTPRAVTVMHPFLEGTDMWGYRSPDGRYLIRELVDPKRFGKVVEYTWQNPGQERGTAYDYAEYFEPWGWIVAYGGTSGDSYLRHLRSILTLSLPTLAITLLILIQVLIYIVRKLLAESLLSS